MVVEVRFRNRVNGFEGFSTSRPWALRALDVLEFWGSLKLAS